MPETHLLEITHLPIGDLRPDPANPRRISDEELESLTRSIREFGLIDPIIARREDKVVSRRPPAPDRCQETRVEASARGPSGHIRRAGPSCLNLALNKISGTWDQELLARLLG